MNYEPHPAALLFPMMSNEELSKLAEDIRQNGLLESVVLYHGLVLDGRNRLAACDLANAQPHFSELDDEITDPYTYVLSKNLCRRHLDHETRAWIAALTMPELMLEAKKRQVSSLKRGDSPSVSDDTNGEETEPSYRTRELVAKIAAVSPQTIQRAWEVTKADPELAEVSRQNKIAPSTARRALDDPDLRAEIIAGGNGRKPGLRRDYKPKEERFAQIRELAGRGYHDTQIAEEIGMAAGSIRQLAIEAGITLPHHISKRRHVDVNRVIEETVIAAEGFTSTLELLAGKTGDLDTSKLSGWIDSLESARIPLGKIIRVLKGVRQ